MYAFKKILLVNIFGKTYRANHFENRLIIRYSGAFYMGCKRNFKWPSIFRVACPIYNDILETFAWLPGFRRYSYFLAGNYVPRNRADKVWNGTVVNQTCPFFTWKVTQNHDYSLFYKIQITYNVKKRTLKRCKNQECWTL